ncbi:MAG: SusC/RagA family TonB-linked outer membrane protein [Saprospiraceae bacterium]|nr:SusC/RagA family TonB-linked outer membrane protein [Saprospiraceae bacterium]MCB9326869.1 SusC/RagA family TonB-linked outer membrane protein [Lewinellaceae bacterium]
MKFYLSLIFSIMTSLVFAQSDLVSGIVTDAETGEPLPGVTIYEKETRTGTVTDVNGFYSLTISGEEAVLVFSFYGYKSIEKTLDERPFLDVALFSDIKLLDEIVVTALGLRRESKKLGYATQSLEGKEISEVKSVNFVDNLAGKIAGLTVSHGATGVGSTSRITIRGESSFTNNNPLFVVDGTPINNNTVLNFNNEAAAGFQEIDFGNGAMEIPSDNVASVSVLKGPGAAALYGTRASNGVVIITTKDGSASDKPTVSINSSVFLEKPFRLPQFQNKYGQGNSGQFEFVDGLGGGINDNITYSWGPALDQGLLIPQFDSPVNLPDGTIVRGGDVAVHGGAPITATPFLSHPDNLKDFYQTGVTLINNVAVASGFDKGHYRLSFTDLRSESIIPGVNLNRQTIAARLAFNPFQKLRIESSLTYVNAKSDNRPANGYGSENINYALVAWGPRSMDIQNLKDYWQPGLENIQHYSFNYTFFDNPYFTLLENRNAFGRDRLFGNISAVYEFTKNLNLRVRSGMDYSDELRTFRRALSSNRFKNGAYAEHTVFYRENNTDFLLNYNKNIGALQVDLSLGGNRLDQQARTVQTQALSLAQPGTYSLTNAASPLEVFQFSSRKRINSFYGLAKVSFKDLVHIDITGRNDWSSALATPTSSDNTSFFYPSVSASFVLSNLMEMPAGISFAKVRASWARAGNDTDPYQTSTAFVAQTPYNAQPTFSASDLIPNTNLLPERTTSVEWGADIRFFDDKLRLDFTAYNALTENQIISLPIPISSGYNQQVVNGGAVRSKGIEAIVGLNPWRSDRFSWNILFNFSENVSTVESLPKGADRITLAYSRVYDNVNQTVWFQVDEGGIIGDIYGTGYLKNKNGDFVIGSDGRYVVDNTLKKLGNYNPDFILAMNNDFQFGNWHLNFLLDWRQGGEIVSRTLSLGGVGGQLIETEDRPGSGIVAEGVVNLGSDESPVWEANTKAIPAESYYRQYYDRNHEENNVYDASYLKLRQLSIGYTFNKGIFRNGRQLDIALVGRNLFALSEIPHFDPEQLAIQGNRFVSGVENMSYATTRSFGFKVGFQF